MKLYAVEFELYDEANEHVATFKAFDSETLMVELKQSMWCIEDIYKFASAYELATKQLVEGIEI